MSEEMKRLPVFQTLTGELLYKTFMKAGDDTLTDEVLHDLWEHSVSKAERQHYGVVARLLNSQLSLYSKCGAQAVALLCDECVSEWQEGARQAEYELRISQTTASEFSSEEAYEKWKEEH